MTGPRHRSPAEDGVPASLRVAAALAWRILVVAAFLLVLGLAVARLRLVVIPSFIALLLAAFLTPPTRRLRSLGVPSSLAALLTMLATAAVIAGIVAALAPQVASEVDEIDLSATPCWGVMSPERTPSIVDLPAPLGPTTATISPAFSVRSTASSAQKSP
jgi:predicted PurR-regulated permease PerM